MQQEIYVSTDVEADGRIPGISSMLSFGSAAFSETGQLLDTFSANLHQLADGQPDAEVMAWWQTQPEAWAACRENPEPPETVMPRYHAWLLGLPGEPVFVGYPVAYDFMWVYWYLLRFVGQSPFSHSALDIKTYAMAKLGIPYRQVSKKIMPRHWLGERPHTHLALDDAIGQGELFCMMLTAPGN